MAYNHEIGIHILKTCLTTISFMNYITIGVSKCILVLIVPNHEHHLQHRYLLLKHIGS